MTRNKEVAFSGTVQYFGGTLLCLVPKTGTGIVPKTGTGIVPKTGEDLQKIINYMNSSVFQKDYMYAGRFKMGHKQISNAIIPT